MRIRSVELDGLTGHEAGRQLLAQMYREFTGKEMPPVLVTQRGKPYFETGDVHFSISHTGKRVFCVLSDKPVGIDAEQMDRDIQLRLADKILSGTEKVRYARAEDPREALLRLWVLKEAYAKATGRGWGSYLYQTDFDPDDPRVIQMQGCFVAVIERNGQWTIDN